MTKRILTLLLLVTFESVSGQSVTKKNSAIKKAEEYANPNSKYYNPSLALDILTQASTKGDAKAMNGLGILYNRGIGVTENHESALMWYEKAATLNYAPAYYNAALMYKNGFGTSQDFKKAYEYFSKSAELNYGSGMYGKGYMLYKGLGCQQNYQQAFELFKKSAPYGNTGSMYMLGLCYRNGYGTNINLDSANYWLHKTASTGDKRAIAELTEVEPENSYGNKNQNNNISYSNPPYFINEKAVTKTKQPIQGNIEGEYSGYIIRYDWSGKNILEQSELKISIQDNGKQLSGEWIEQNSNATFQAELKDSILIFNNTFYKKPDRYQNSTQEIEFKDARLQLIKNGDSVFLAGNIELYSIYEKEPSRPTYISLIRKPAAMEEKTLATTQNTKTLINKISEEEKTIIEDIKIYPNPFTQSLSANFHLNQAGDVNLILLNIAGNIIYNENIRLQEGPHIKEITVNAPPGVYIFKIKYNNKTHNSIVIKK